MDNTVKAGANSEAGEHCHALGSVIGVTGLENEMTIKNSTFRNNTLTLDSGLGSTNQDIGAAVFIGTDRGTNNPDGHAVTLLADSGGLLEFDGNQIVIDGDESSGALLFGRAWYLEMDTRNDSAADARLSVNAKSGGIIRLLDPVLVDMNNDKSFAMTVDVDDNGEFRWGGENLFRVHGMGTATLDFLTGVTNLGKGFTLTADPIQSTEMTVTAASGTTLNAGGGNVIDLGDAGTMTFAANTTLGFDIDNFDVGASGLTITAGTLDIMDGSGKLNYNVDLLSLKAGIFTLVDTATSGSDFTDLDLDDANSRLTYQGGATSRRFLLDISGTDKLVLTATLADGGSFADAMPVAIAGTLIYDRSTGNDYTQTTAVTGGELRLDGGSVGQTGIASGGVLSGTGSVLGFTAEALRNITADPSLLTGATLFSSASLTHQWNLDSDGMLSILSGLGMLEFSIVDGDIVFAALAAAMNADAPNRVSASGMGQREDLDTTSGGIAGYQYRAGGMAVGYDRAIGAFSYLGGKFEDKPALANDSRLDNYFFDLYADYTHCSGLGLTLMGGYTYTDNDMRRRLARFDASSGTAVAVPGWEKADYSTDRIGRVKNHSASLPIGIEAAYAIDLAPETSLRLEGRVEYSYELHNRGAKGALTYGGIANAPRIDFPGRAPGRSSWNVGGGVMLTRRGIDIGVCYDYYARKDFDAHRVTASVGWSF